MCSSRVGFIAGYLCVFLDYQLDCSWKCLANLSNTCTVSDTAWAHRLAVELQKEWDLSIWLKDEG